MTFGNVVATEKALKYLNNTLNSKQIKEFNHIITEQENKKPDITLRVGTFFTTFLNRQTPTDYLIADVAKKHWTDKWFTSPFGVIKKAVRYAENFDGELAINNNIVKK